MELQLQLWQVVIGGLVTLLVGGGTGGLAYAFLGAKDLAIKREEAKAEAVEAARLQVNTQWATLVGRYDAANAAQAKRIAEQDALIETLQKEQAVTSNELTNTKNELATALHVQKRQGKELAATRQELTSTKAELATARQQITQLSNENVVLKQTNERLTNKVQALEQARAKDDHGH